MKDYLPAPLTAKNVHSIALITRAREPSCRDLPVPVYQVPEADFHKVVGRISFFVNAGVHFVTEMCKMRAFTELWDRICLERCGVTDPKFHRFRYGVQANSLGLTEQQPENNVIRRKTRRRYSAEEKSCIVLEGLRGEHSITELCRREGIAQSQYYCWPKKFLEAGKPRLTGDTERQATSNEVTNLRRDARDLKEVVADLTLENRLLKKSMIADGGDLE